MTANIYPRSQTGLLLVEVSGTPDPDTPECSLAETNLLGWRLGVAVLVRSDISSILGEPLMSLEKKLVKRVQLTMSTDIYNGPTFAREVVTTREIVEPYQSSEASGSCHQLTN